MTTYQSHLEITPNKRGGKPCIKGTRITVYDILGALAHGSTADDILRDFPELTHHQIEAFQHAGIAVADSSPACGAMSNRVTS